MIRNAIRVVTSLLLLAAPATLAAQDTTVYLIPPPAAPPPVACPPGPGGIQSLTAPGLDSQLRQSCDASWKSALEAHTTGRRSYGDFMSECAKACSALQTQAQTPSSSVPQLNQLAANAANPTAVAAPSTASGLNTALIIGGVAAAAAGIAVAVSNDGPASP